MHRSELTNEVIDRVVKEAADQLQKSIDEGILLDLLVDGGWTKFPYEIYNTSKAIEMAKYCKNTFKQDQWEILNGHFVFREKKDAEWFVLRWS